MISLGVDTSNYATSLAVVDADKREVLWAEKRFLPVGKGELGLRQSDAVFHHTVALPALLAQAPQAVLQKVGAVGVSGRPRPVEGAYMPCFLAGAGFAAAFAAGRGVPLATTSHQEGHLAAALFELGSAIPDGPPYVFFHISGGTSEWWLARGHHPQQRLGGSLDLHAGQAVDRLGVRLGYGFPAGKAVSKLAAGCAEEPRPKTSVRGLDCHFSGLQNQCEQLLAQGQAPASVAKFCLLSIAETLALIIETLRATHRDIAVVCAGGVMASETIRAALTRRFDGIYFVSPQLSADNAVGVAYLAGEAADD